jgi:hypothetical protein
MSLHDKLGNYLKVCDNIEPILGYKKSEIIGKSAYEFFNPDFLPVIVKSHLSSVLTSVKYQLVNKNGKFIYVNTLSFRTVDDGENKDDQIYCVTKKMNEFEIIIFKIFLVVQEITKKIKFIKLKLLS